MLLPSLLPPDAATAGLRRLRPTPDQLAEFRTMKTVLSCLLFFNLLCFLLFALDKRKAREGQRRIAEETLHLATLPGAAPGAWAAILLLHHKNRKAAFWNITLVLTLLQGAVLHFTLPYFRVPI